MGAPGRLRYIPRPSYAVAPDEVEASPTAIFSKSGGCEGEAPEPGHSGLIWCPIRLSTYSAGMPIDGDYEPSSLDLVREQVAEYEASGGERANTLMDTGLPIIVLTTRGNKSGKVRKMALMRVEHQGEYALVASQGGMPTNPSWHHNLIADPTALVIQDGAEPHDFVAREVIGDEKAVWWDRAVAAYPPYAEYQAATTRVIPVLVARRADA